MIEVQMEGYDKLSDDMNEALDRAVNAINGKAEELKIVAGQVLASLDGHGKNVTDTVDSIIEGNGTKIHDETTGIIEELNKENGITDLLSNIGASWSGLDIKTALETRVPENSVKNIDTNLGLIKDSLGNIKAEDIKRIETSLGIISNSIEKTEVEKATREAKAKEIQDQIHDLEDKIAVKKLLVGDYEEKKKNTTNGSEKGKLDEKIKSANNSITNFQNTIASLQKQLENLNNPNYIGTTGETARGEENIGGAKANRHAELKAELDKLKKAQTEQQNKITAQNNIISKSQKEISDYEASIKRNAEQAQRDWNQGQAYADSAAALTQQAKKTKKKKDKNKLNNDANVAASNANFYYTRSTNYTNEATRLKNGQNSYNSVRASAIATAQTAINNLQPALDEINAQITAKQEELDALIKEFESYASGSKRINKKQLAWTNEDFDKIGSEIIVRPSDGAILTPLKAGDSVIPANLADNLFKWGAISPDQFATNPFMGKWDAQGSSIGGGDNIVNMPQQVQLSFDSLFHIEGNVDAEMMPRLENLGKSLVNNREFQKNVIKFVTKDFVRESKKQGIR